VLLKLTDPFSELARGDGLVRLSGAMDDQHPGSRVTTPTGVEACIQGPVALVVATAGRVMSLMVEQI